MKVDFSSAVRTLATAALLIAGTAHASTIVPELGIGRASGSAFEATGDSQVLQWGVGYYLDNGVGVRLMGFGDLDPTQGWLSTTRTFNSTLGLQVVDQLPLGDRWVALLGAGVGRTRYNLPDNSTQSENETEGLVSVGVNWKPATHFALSLQYTYLTQSSVATLSLMAQVPF
jgi:hypothetical protein